VPERDRPPRVLSVEAALNRLGHGLDPDDAFPPAATPLLVVDVAAPQADAVHRLATITRQLPAVVVGVGGPDSALDGAVPAEGFDVLVSGEPQAPRPWVGSTDVDATLAQLAGAVAASPRAATALVELLRAGSGLGLPDSVVAESWVYSMLQSGDRFAAWLHDRPAASHRAGSEPAVLVSRSSSLLVIELNRPAVRNALDTAMRDLLIDAFRTAVADPSIERIHVSGRGASFCSGGDLTEFGSAPDPVTAHLVRVTRSVGLWLHRCATRVEVDVHGTCIGAGVEIPAFAATVRASRDAVFVLPEVSMGLVPGAGGTASVSRRVGRHRTAYLALSGVPLSAVTALGWGLVDTVVDP
jgi:hypothetical protein